MLPLQVLFDASAGTIRVRVHAIKEMTNRKGEVVQQTMTSPHPETIFTLDELQAREPKLASDLAAILGRLEPVARQQAADDIADPKDVMAKALELQTERLKLRQEREQHDAEIAKAKEQAFLEEENAKKLRQIQEEATREAEAKAAAAAVEHQRLTDQIAVMQATLAASRAPTPVFDDEPVSDEPSASTR